MWANSNSNVSHFRLTDVKPSPVIAEAGKERSGDVMELSKVIQMKALLETATSALWNHSTLEHSSAVGFKTNVNRLIIDYHSPYCG